MKYFDEVEKGDSVRCVVRCADNSLTIGKIYRVFSVLKSNSDYDVWVGIINNNGILDDYHLSLFEDVAVHRNEIIDAILK